MGCVMSYNGMQKQTTNTHDKSEAYVEPNRTSRMELFCKIDQRIKPNY